MIDTIGANWPIVVVLVVAAFVIWWLFGRRKDQADLSTRAPDALDPGAEPAQRNQALIDAPAAAATAALVTPEPVPEQRNQALIDAPIATATAAVVTSEPEPEPEPEPVAATVSAVPEPQPIMASALKVDDLTRIKGIGPKLNAMLVGHGVTRYAQIAAWTENDLADIDQHLGNFSGRPARDNWIEQAKLLANGDAAGFEAKFGKG